MSTDIPLTLDDSYQPASPRTTRRKQGGFYATVQQVLKPVASLKLTVVLFALSIFLVFAGTMAQTQMGVWQAVHGYFRTWVAYIEIQVFFPPAFFPNDKKPPTFEGGFFFPGGWTIGSLLAVNLLSAHLVRFKAQARGTRLYAGLGVILLGAIVTVLVIFSGSMGNGVQTEPLVSYETLWKFFLGGMTVLWLVLTGSIVSLEMGNAKQTRTIRIALSVVSVALGGLLAWLLVLQWKGTATPLSDPSMRILWQLTQASISSLILLAGCVMVFKKRGGMVMLHVGVAVLMFSELLVGLVAVEEHIQMFEGETTNFARDSRTIEMAIIDSSNPEKKHVVVVPKNKLSAVSDYHSKNVISSIFTKMFYGKPNPIISHEELPFDIRIEKFYHNSAIERSPSKSKTFPHIKGIGKEISVSSIKQTTGVDDDDENTESVYVTLLSKEKEGETVQEEKDRVLGTWLITRHFSHLGIEQPVLVGDKIVKISLRYKRTYKPYSILLKDVRADKYQGSSKTLDYRSTVQLVDKKNNVNREVDIWMNNPLRYSGETFYQTNYQVASNGKEVTTLSVVTNLGWMMPYVACMLVWWGMLYHFAQILLRFSSKEIQKPAKIVKQVNKENSLETETPRLALLQQWLPVIIVVIFGGWFLSKARPPKVPKEMPNPQAFAKLPIVYEGRTKPFDSFARNNLMVFSHKSELHVTLKDEDDPEKTSTEKRPAINWLLDLMVDQEKADKYEIFRVVNQTALDTLKLPRRKSHLYSYEEIMEQGVKLVQSAETARQRKIDKKWLSAGERKLISLYGKIDRYQAIRKALALSPKKLDSFGKQIRFLSDAHDAKNKTVDTPLGIPQANKEAEKREDKRNWKSFTTAAANVWIHKIASEKNFNTPSQLEDYLLSQLTKEKSVDDIVSEYEVEQALPFILSIELKRRSPNKSNEQCFQDARKMIYSPQKKSPLNMEVLRTVTLQEYLQRRKEGIGEFAKKITGSNDLTTSPEPIGAQLVAVLIAYRNQDAEAFDSAIAEYRKTLNDGSFEEVDLKKSEFEVAFNQMAPFYYPAFLYVFAFIFAMFSFVGWREPLRKSAFWLIVFTFAIHTFAVLSRIYISGRPPVTNLYSSAAFVGWATVLAGIVIEIIFRIGLGNAIATATGAAALGIAHFLSHDGDTITVMQAVLDSQFWLATHVVCISLGYAATFFAGFIGVYTLILRAFEIMFPAKALRTRTPAETKELMRLLYRVCYGIVCFAIFFSFVGTVLGGLWGDDSWGRFWGWDPKENGALMIVIWNALVLHARWGGMVKERGFAALVVVGNIMTSWSWFGVNELGVGLHNYGFTEGVLFALELFAISQLVIICLVLIPDKREKLA